MPTLILMYHDISDDVNNVRPEHRPYVLDPATFRLQIGSVAAQRLHVLTVTQWCTSSQRQIAIVLTFDDGHASNYDFALPILVEFGLKATFFITAGRIGTGDIMNWRQIRALHSVGMEIGSHTLTHRPPTMLSDKELRHELLESRRILQDGLGAPVTSISSPTGFFNARMRDIAREVGYRALCIGQVGLAGDDADPFSLNRVAVKRAMSNKRFQALLQFDPNTLVWMRSQQWVRDLARRTLGVESYLRIRRILIRTSHS